jgi:hypothetical protein
MDVIIGMLRWIVDELSADDVFVGKVIHPSWKKTSNGSVCKQRQTHHSYCH